VLYICLCGFPPFSDELYSADNPYTLSQQIKQGRFDFPSPYWDSVGDPALDLIDRMLTVDVDQRITIDECLEHPWITQRTISVTDSTDGLTGALRQLDFSKRKIHRERTLLSAINDVKVSKIVEVSGDSQPIKVFEKNHTKNPKKIKAATGKAPPKEANPAANREAAEFIEMGGKGDVELFEDDHGSVYPQTTMKAEAQQRKTR
jgi:serine/threonine-protein kinase CHEK2